MPEEKQNTSIAPRWLGRVILVFGIFVIMLSVCIHIVRTRVNDLVGEIDAMGDAIGELYAYRMFTTDDAITGLTELNTLRDDQIEAVKTALNNNTVNAHYSLQYPDRVSIEGTGTRVYKYMTCADSFSASFQRMGDHWQAYDWYWVAVPEITIPAGRYEATIDGTYRYRVDVSYQTDYGIGSRARVVASEIYEDYINVLPMAEEYEATRVDADHVTFIYELPNGSAYLYIGYDGQLLWNGYELKPVKDRVDDTTMSEVQAT